jgi:hypothetical protein
MTLESWSSIARQLGNRVNTEKGGFLSGCVYAYFVTFILICSFGVLYVVIAIIIQERFIPILLLFFPALSYYHRYHDRHPYDLSRPVTSR